MDGSNKRPRILILERSAEIGELLRRTLLYEDYEAHVGRNVDELMTMVTEHRPDLLLLDLGARAEDESTYRPLDELRADPVARSLPVIVLTTSSVLADSARASSNVAVSLVKPFDLEELLIAIRTVLHLQSLQPPTSEPPDTLDALAFAEQVLAERSREAIFRWIQRLMQEEPWRDREDLRLSGLLDDIPVLVQAVQSRLHYGNVDAFFDRHPDVRAGVREHASIRYRQGIALGPAIREYALLREELTRVLRLHLPDHLGTAAVFDIVEALDAMLDRIISGTAEAYTNIDGGGERSPGT